MIQYSLQPQAEEAIVDGLWSISRKLRAYMKIQSQTSLFPALHYDSFSCFYTPHQFALIPLPVFTSYLYTSHLSVRERSSTLLSCCLTMQNLFLAMTDLSSEVFWHFQSCSGFLGLGNVMIRWIGIYWHFRVWTHYQERRDKVGRDG